MSRRKAIANPISSEFLGEDFKTRPRKERIEIHSEFEDQEKNKVLLDRLKKSPIKLSEKQKQLSQMIMTNTLTICQGPAGTSKTMSTAYTALNALFTNKVKRIIITKPLKESGENLGFLPGDKEDKIEPFYDSFIYTFNEILDKKTIESLVKQEKIVSEPLAFMRGKTFNDSFFWCDECQNMTMTQIMLWVTRLGRNSIGIMTGDVSQYDIHKRDAKFLEFLQLMDGVSGLSTFNFQKEDIVRNSFLIEIVDRYEKEKYGKAGESL